MILELEKVIKRYDSPDGGQALTVLDDISLKVDSGDSVAIVGPSGSGKSTLLNIIGALDRPSSGKVSFDGQDISSLADEELSAIRNRKIGFIFQLHHLLPQCTVLENVLVPTIPMPHKSEDAEKRARRLLDRVGLGGRLFHRPGQLSGGECQRVAVVRALINKPKLLLADEPTGSLDHASAVDLGQLLLELNKEENVTLLLVTHSQDLARHMQRVLTLHDGRLNEEASS